MRKAGRSILIKPSAKNGTSSAHPFDRWFRYPAGLSTDALSRLFQPSRNPLRGAVVDPFSGAATVGTMARAAGLNFYGIEAHPEIAELAQLKVSQPVLAVNELSEAAEKIAARARDITSRLSEIAPVLSSENELVQRCFSPDTLSELVAIRSLVFASPVSTRPYLKWALLGSLRDVASVKVGWPYLRPSLTKKPRYTDVGARFVTRTLMIQEDLTANQSENHGQVIRGDSTKPQSWRRLRKISAGDRPTVCLTSPPYLNNFDYADATRLEMYFWGRNATWGEMVSDVRRDMIVATTQQTSVANQADSLNKLVKWPSVHEEVENLCISLAAERRNRKAGKAYDRVLPSYMLGIMGVLTQLKQTMAPGSWCGWVVGDSAPYGIYVDTPELILLAARALKYEVGESVIIRPRGEKWVSNTMRHTVALNERLIWFRTPDQPL